MWINSKQEAVSDSGQYTDENGTTYPTGFPRQDIPGLFPVTTTEPAINVNQRKTMTGFELVEGVWCDIWEVTDFTAEEIEAARVAAVPTAVLMRQARYALLGAGMLGAVQGFLDAIPPGVDKEVASIEWLTSETVRRDNPLVAAAAASLGLTSLQLDDLFTYAATIV